jgi:protein-disulfide isomerase
MSSKQIKQSATKKQAQREERLKRERERRLRLILMIAGGTALIVIAIVAINYFTKQSAANKLGEVVQITPIARPNADRNNMGDPNAPVKIVEYSDFQCPYCKQFADTTLQAIIDTYVTNGKVYFTYRSMGNFVSQNIGSGGTESRDSAEAAYCAGEQNKFWEYSQSLFANWQGEEVGSFSPSRLNEIAKSLGLETTQFSDCLKSSQFRDQVDQDQTDGRAAGITATPSFLINGKLIVGALPIADFQKEIDAAISAAGQ